MKLTRFVSFIVRAGLCCGLISCGSAQREIKIPNKLTTFEVTGEVLVDDEPAAFVTVRLKPLKAGGLESKGITDANGIFKISTYGSNDGAPAGEYAVIFTRRPITGTGLGADAFGERYATVKKAPLKVVVEDGPLDIGQIELRSK
jgi:hypothetical protein